MASQPPTSIHQYFGELNDPRGQNVRHPLLSIITIAICGTLCGADNWVDIEMDGQAKQDWLSTFLDLPHGIPWHDTLGRVFRRLDPEDFQRSFHTWTLAICELTQGEVVAIDGKQGRRSKDGVPGKDGIHMVSVGASENQLVLGQENVDDHSNEITAIPRVRHLLDLAGSIVTIDAIGCQTEIARTIMDQEADYVIAVKAHQGTLFDDVAAAFETLPPGVQLPYTRTIDKDHGRIEIRECWVTDDPAILHHIQAYKAWSKSCLNGAGPTRPLTKRAISLPVYRRMLLICFRWYGLTGISKIDCTGYLILRFVRMKTGCAKTLPLTI